MAKINVFGGQKPAEVELEQKTNILVVQAQQLVITNETQAQTVRSFIEDCKAQMKEIVAHHKEPKEKAYAAWKSMVAAENKLMDPLNKAIAIGNQLLSSFLQDQENKRHAEQLRLDKERQEKERQLREAAQSQVDELLKSSASTAEKIKGLTEKLETATDEQASILRASIRALESAEQNSSSVAESIHEEIDMAIATSTVPAVQEKIKVAGVAGGWRPETEVTDLKELCRAIGAGEVPPGVVKVAEGPLKNHVSAVCNGGKTPGDRAKRVPGCRITWTVKAHTRGR